MAQQSVGGGRLCAEDGLGGLCFVENVAEQVCGVFLEDVGRIPSPVLRASLIALVAFLLLGIHLGEVLQFLLTELDLLRDTAGELTLVDQSLCGLNDCLEHRFALRTRRLLGGVNDFVDESTDKSIAGADGVAVEHDLLADRFTVGVDNVGEARLNRLPAHLREILRVKHDGDFDLTILQDLVAVERLNAVFKLAFSRDVGSTRRLLVGCILRVKCRGDLRLSKGCAVCAAVFHQEKAEGRVVDEILIGGAIHELTGARLDSTLNFRAAQRFSQTLLRRVKVLEELLDFGR